MPEYWQPPGKLTAPLETAAARSTAPSAAGHGDAQEAEEPLTIKAPEPEEPPSNSSAPPSSDAGESTGAEVPPPDAAAAAHSESSPSTAAAIESAVESLVHQSTADQSTVNHSTVHNATASESDGPSAAPLHHNSTASDAADLPPSAEVPSTPASVAHAEGGEAGEEAAGEEAAGEEAAGEEAAGEADTGAQEAAAQEAEAQLSQHFSLSTQSEEDRREASAEGAAKAEVHSP